MLDLAGRYSLGEFCELIDGLDLFPVEPQRGEVSRLYRRWTFHSAALDLALRQAGTPLHAGAGARAAAADVRRLAAPRRAADARADLEPAGPLPDAALQARRHHLVDARADRGAGRDRRGGLDRLQGAVPRHHRRPGARPGAVSARRRGLPRRVAGGPRPRHRRHRRALAGEHDRITWDAPIHSIADIEALPVRAADGQHQAVADRRAAASCATPTTTAPSTASAPTAAASSSWARAAARPSTWPRCFTPTRPTTWRRWASTRTTRRRAGRQPAAGSRRRRRLSLGLGP